MKQVTLFARPTPPRFRKSTWIQKVLVSVGRLGERGNDVSTSWTVAFTRRISRRKV